MISDTYLTIASPAEGLYKDKGSRFLAFAYPIFSETDVKPLVDALKEKYYDARHHCYAWRLGPKGETFRANDDGEPSSTAGRPILGQLLSNEVTDALIVVVRYFGGTKLGVSGLIETYKAAAAAAIGTNRIVERTVDDTVSVIFPYMTMNDIMRTVKELAPAIVEQDFDTVCSMKLRIRRSRAPELFDRLRKIDGAQAEYDNANN